MRFANCLDIRLEMKISFTFFMTIGLNLAHSLTGLAGRLCIKLE